MSSASWQTQITDFQTDTSETLNIKITELSLDSGGLIQQSLQVSICQIFIKNVNQGYFMLLNTAYS